MSGTGHGHVANPYETVRLKPSPVPMSGFEAVLRLALDQVATLPRAWPRFFHMAIASDPQVPINFADALRTASKSVEQHLAHESGLEPDHVRMLMFVAAQQTTTIPHAASGVGRPYRRALGILTELREAGLMVRWPSHPARFALSQEGGDLVEQMNAAVWGTIAAAHGVSAAMITAKALKRLNKALDQTPGPRDVRPSGLSETAVAALFLRVEPQVIDAWVRIGALPPSPWSEDDLRTMIGLRGSVTAVWPELLAGARRGEKFADLSRRLGITTQKVASAIGRDPELRAELDASLMEGRDPGLQHGGRIAYRQGCWCPECREAQSARS